MRRRRLKKSVKRFLFLFIVAVLAVACYKGLLYFDKADKKSFDIKKMIKFGEYVKSKEEIPLYILKNGKYLKRGLVGKNVILHLSNSNSKYYLIKDLDKDYYVAGSNLENFNNKVIVDDRYKKYIVFNENISTNNKTNLYDENDNLIYSINESYSLPIIVKDDNRYGVEFGNRLLYIKKEEGNVIEHHNTDENNISGVATLNYHAFYDDDNASEKGACVSDICHSDTQFREHLDYIKENNILTLKIHELENYIDGKIQLPKSVLITIDDGGMTEVAVNMLTEYKMYATIFLVTSWYDPKNYYVTDYIELHSHSHHMHETGVCPRGQGGGIQCLSEEKIQEDLSETRKLLNNTTYFCYPFYEYNNYSIEQLEKAGFTMAFVGESTKTDNLAKVGMNKFKIPRFVIVTYTTMNDLEKYFNGMH